MTKIMLVEDDKSLREIYGIRLVAEGYEIKSASDGEEALAMAIKERPDLIISDVMMPKISGFDMLDILRATPETKDIKIIMMTALSSEDQRARGESLGANRYLVKSQVGIEDVVRTVHDVLADTPIAAAPSATQLFGAPVASAVADSKPFTMPSQPVSTPSPASTMPQPTAPFSTQAPASLGENIIKPTVFPQATASPAPVPTPPTTQTPAPAPAPQPIPVTQPTPTPIPVHSPKPTPTMAQIPTQDIVIPEPPTPTTPDISALIAQELGNNEQTPPAPAQ